MIRHLPYIPILAACIILLDISSSHARSGSLSLGSGSGTPNQTFTVSVDMTNDTRIVGFQFDIVESVNAVDIVNVVIDSTHIDTTRQWALSLNRVNAVTTKVVVFDFNLKGIPSGSGPFAEITYRVRSDVLSGTYPIHLRAVVLADAGAG